MLPHQLCNLAKLRRPEASTVRETDWVEPELGHMPIALDVDVGRLSAVARVEKEPIGTNS
jgi:hypothetical protein